MTGTLGGKLISGYVTTVIKFPYLMLRSAATDLLFDRRYGVRTAGRIEASELGLDERSCLGYCPAGWMSPLFPLLRTGDYLTRRSEV